MMVFRHSSIVNYFPGYSAVVQVMMLLQTFCYWRHLQWWLSWNWVVIDTVQDCVTLLIFVVGSSWWMTASPSCVAALLHRLADSSSHLAARCSYLSFRTGFRVWLICLLSPLFMLFGCSTSNTSPLVKL